MDITKFVVTHTLAGDVWAEARRDTVVLLRGDLTRAQEEVEGEMLFEISKEGLRGLIAWAEPNWVNVSFSGQLAREIADSAFELGMTPQNFAIEAVNAFIQAGRMGPH